MPSKVTLTVFALIAMAAGFWLATILNTTARDDRPQIQGAVLNTARQIAVPELVRHDDRPFTNADLSGQWTLMFYGYASCPDICPMQNGKPPMTFRRL